MASSRHVLAIPYPGRGHINPMMVLSRQLTTRGIHVTFVLTQEWLGLINSSHPLPPPELNIMTIPNCIPSEHGRAKDFLGFIKAVYSKMTEPFEELLDRLEPAPRVIIADMYLPWIVEVGNRRGIPVCLLQTMSAAFSSILLHFKSIPPPESRNSSEKETDETLEKYIPSLRSIRLSDVDLMFAVSSLELGLHAASAAKKAQCMLFTSAYEFESCTIDSLRKDLNYPVFAIGPSIPHMLLPEAQSSDHLTWLDSQPENSVLYISLGSFLSVSLSQFEEIAKGIHASAVNFFWVARENSSLVQKICGDKGLVVPWCDQLKILTHPSIGGFLTHCGFNSTLESLFAGVPVLALPIFWDQLSNSRLLTDEWKIGTNLRDKRGKEEILGREDIKHAVKKLMDLRDTDSVLQKGGTRGRVGETRADRKKFHLPAVVLLTPVTRGHEGTREERRGSKHRFYSNPYPSKSGCKISPSPLFYRPLPSLSLLITGAQCESTEIRKRTADWSRATKNAVKEGGSSFNSLGHFIREFIDE